MEEKVLQTNSVEETQQEAEKFAEKLQGGDTLLLFGNLGAGKTTFLQGVAKGLGVTKRIISPTFIIVRHYDLPSLKNQTTQLYHIDLYRTETHDDLLGLGIPEILQEKSAIIAIEWPEKLGKLTPQKRWELHFDTIDDKTRKIVIKKYE